MQACGGSVGDAQVKNDKLFFFAEIFLSRGRSAPGPPGTLNVIPTQLFA
jgi:hypothetical protein